tara:strand:+ start:122633 stop:122908 length:276 start_codon:yes stop_codon:yes gene_type:complete
VQISLIAGSIALGASTSKCNKSISSAKISSYQKCQENRDNVDFFLIDPIAQLRVKTRHISLAVQRISETHFIIADPALSLKSGLSPPTILV